jgi:hypothetical protein
MRRVGSTGETPDRVTVRRGYWHRFGCLTFLLWMRAGLTMDRRSRSIVAWWGAFLFLKRRTMSMDEARQVNVTRETREDWSGSHRRHLTVYAVKIEGKGGPLIVEEPTDHDRARRVAERVAKFLGLGIADSSSGSTIRREAGTLDMSLREKLRARGEKLDPPATPPRAKAKVEYRGGDAVIDVPPEGFSPFVSPGVWVLVAAAVAIATGASANTLNLDAWDGEPIPQWWIAVIGILGACVGGYLFVRDYRSAAWPQRISVGPHGLRAERISPAGAAALAREIPLEELEEVNVEGPLVAARSDRATIEIGRGLDRAELAWIRDVIAFVVAS